MHPDLFAILEKCALPRIISYRWARHRLKIRLLVLDHTRLVVVVVIFIANLTVFIRARQALLANGIATTNAY